MCLYLLDYIVLQVLRRNFASHMSTNRTSQNRAGNNKSVDDKNAAAVHGTEDETSAKVATAVPLL